MGTAIQITMVYTQGEASDRRQIGSARDALQGQKTFTERGPSLQKTKTLLVDTKKRQAPDNHFLC